MMKSHPNLSFSNFTLTYRATRSNFRISGPFPGGAAVEAGIDFGKLGNGVIKPGKSAFVLCNCVNSFVLDELATSHELSLSLFDCLVTQMY